jgi:Ser/Thr protein kinase RdoA (MazF antagonist)
MRTLTQAGLPVPSVTGRSSIHNDANDYNILVGPALNAPSAVSGILDFGDVRHTARVCNAAICGAYLAPYRADPIDSLCEVVRGYHRELPLSENELQVFFTLACTRLAVSVCISAAQ